MQKKTMRVCINLMISLIALSAADNYPDNYFNRKACARLKNTVNIQAQLCASTENSFVKGTDINCVKLLKGRCPEFNEAECTHYNLRFPHESSPMTTVPACKLYYYARYTWMEIFYTNYFYTNDDRPDFDPFDIVEIHRNIKKHKAFGNRDQEDWPKSVIDTRGQRGLKWIDVNNSKLVELPPNVTSRTRGYYHTDLCANVLNELITDSGDESCDKAFVSYLKENYKNGFEPQSYPVMSKWESDNNATVTTELEGKCNYVLMRKPNGTGLIRRPACQVVYTRRAKISSQSSNYHESSFEFLEVQLYQAVLNSTKPADYRVKYAYWSDENPEERDQIFSNGQ